MVRAIGAKSDKNARALARACARSHMRALARSLVHAVTRSHTRAHFVAECALSLRHAHKLRKHDGHERGALDEVEEPLLVGLEGGLQEKHDDKQADRGEDLAVGVLDEAADHYDRGLADHDNALPREHAALDAVAVVEEAKAREDLGRVQLRALAPQQRREEQREARAKEGDEQAGDAPEDVVRAVKACDAQVLRQERHAADLVGHTVEHAEGGRRK
jgi:hypothetical protein